MNALTNGDKLKILFSTDQHLNHSRMNPKRMVERLLQWTTYGIYEHKPDVLALGGDWFDRPTSFTSKAGVHILDAMSMLCSICEQRGIALWVLKGTGTHDGTQNDNWKPIAAGFKNLQFRIFDTVGVTTEMGLNILTIPDSTIPNHHKCELEVRRTMAEAGLTTVDLMLSHGMFTHHVENSGFKVEAHDSEFYNSIIDIVGLNGHVHTPSLYGKILTGGSFDRLRQGENHAKGLHIVEIDKTANTFSATFIENKDAAIFNSYEVMGLDPNKEIAHLSSIVSTLSADDIYVRLHYHKDVPIRAIERELVERFPDVVFDSTPNQKAIDALRKEREIELTADIPEGISRDTLIDLVGEKFTRMEKEFTPNHKSILKEIRDGIG